MIKIEKEKPAKREIKLFSVEVTLTPDAEDHMQQVVNLSVTLEGAEMEETED